MENKIEETEKALAEKMAHPSRIGEHVLLISEHRLFKHGSTWISRVGVKLTPEERAAWIDSLVLIDVTITDERYDVPGVYDTNEMHAGYLAKDAEGNRYQNNWMRFDEVQMNPSQNWKLYFGKGIEYTVPEDADEDNLDNWQFKSGQPLGYYLVRYHAWDALHMLRLVLTPEEIVSLVNRQPGYQVAVCDHEKWRDYLTREGRELPSPHSSLYFAQHPTPKHQETCCFLCAFQNMKEARRSVQK